jgi:Na+-translocating ferredoxin:NAD+ oxidoreductase RnfE subunit
VAILPPGGFLTLGLLLAVKRMIDLKAGKAIATGPVGHCV